MGNEQCHCETSIEEDSEAFAKNIVQPCNSYKIFSKTYKLERDEDCSLSIIDQIEPNFYLTNDVYRKKRTLSCVHTQSAPKLKKVNSKKKLKPAIKENTNNSSSNHEPSNKTVRWDNLCQKELVN